jgi:hypothetical protein
VEESIRKKYDDNIDYMFIIVSFLQRVLRLGGGWAGVKLGGDSVSHMFEVAGAIPEFLNEFLEKKMIVNAPFNWQIIPMEYGHLAHIEMLCFYDVTQPNHPNVMMPLMQRSAETDIKHGFHASTPMASNPALGPLYSNFNLWVEKIKKAFDPAAEK